MDVGRITLEVEQGGLIRESAEAKEKQQQDVSAESAWRKGRMLSVLGFGLHTYFFLSSTAATLVGSFFGGTMRRIPPAAMVWGITCSFCFTSTAQKRFLCEPVGHFTSTATSNTTS